MNPECSDKLWPSGYIGLSLEDARCIERHHKCVRRLVPQATTEAGQGLRCRYADVDGKSDIPQVGKLASKPDRHHADQGSNARAYCTALIMSKIGRYMATTMPPTT